MFRSVFISRLFHSVVTIQNIFIYLIIGIMEVHINQLTNNNIK